MDHSFDTVTILGQSEITKKDLDQVLQSRNELIAKLEGGLAASTLQLGFIRMLMSHDLRKAWKAVKILETAMRAIFESKQTCTHCGGKNKVDDSVCEEELSKLSDMMGNL